jgi:hypothetical protein
VQSLIDARLGDAPPGEICVLSLCAGDGRDLLGVLEHHPRRDDVRALLIEFDEGLVDAGRRRIDALGLEGVTFAQADAGDTHLFGTSRDLQLVLACGIFGNIVEDDIRRSIEGFSVLLAKGGSAIWTRHRLAPDLTPAIRSWFTAAGFEETAFVSLEGSSASVGCNLLVDDQPGRRLPTRLFEFIGDGAGGLV